MPRKPSRTVKPPLPKADDVMDTNIDDEIPGNRDVKYISELINDTDHNLPVDRIENDIERFSAFSDLSNWFGIPEYFETLSSISRRASTYDNWENRFKVVDYLISCHRPLYDDVLRYVSDYVEQKSKGEEVAKYPLLVNAFNMFIILVQRFIVQIQLYVSKFSAANQSKQRGTKVQITSLDNEISEWKKTKRFRLVRILHDYLTLKVEIGTTIKRKALKYIFAPHAIERELLVRFMDTVNQLLEDPENSARSNQTWITQYLKIWKILAADFNMSTDIANSLFQYTLELPYLEAANSYPFIEPLVRMMRENQQDRVDKTEKDMLYYTVKQIVRRAVALYDGERADRLPPKAYCMIIQSLALNVPEIMLIELQEVFKLLNNPHPNVRMSTLQALSDLFASSYLSKERCADFNSRKQKRDKIFQRIVAHTNDEGTHVRSKAISLLRHLMETRKIPEEFECSGFLSIVGSRLKDRSVQVRKSAMQFLASFLDNNSYGHDFNRPVHVQNLEAKMKELNLMNSRPTRYVKEAEELLTRIKFFLKGLIKSELTALFKGDISEGTQQLSTSVYFANLENPSNVAGLTRFYAANENFPFPESFRQQHANNGLEYIDEATKNILDRIHNDYLIYKANEQNQDQDKVMEEEQTEQDINHTKLQLRAQAQHLIDKMIIEEELAECVINASKCLIMGETAEIKEGIKFLTRCKLFEITGAEDAIRSMCSLVWRPSADVLEELIEAAEDMFISKLSNENKLEERDLSTVDNLMSAMSGVSEEDRSSVEEVIYLLASPELERKSDEKATKLQRKRRPIEMNVITRLWNIALDSTREHDQRKIVALRILYPISKTEKGLPEARSRLRSIQKKLVEEPAVAVEALRIISILGTPTLQEKEPDAYNRPIFRVHQDDSLFKSIEQLFFHEVIKADDDPNRDWFNIIRLTISTILNISMDVNVMLPKFAAHFLYRAVKVSEFYMFYCKKVEQSQDEVRENIAAHRRDYWALTWCRVMEKLMAFCGEVAVQLNAYIQVSFPRLHSRYVTKIVEAEKNELTVREEPVRYLTELEKSIAHRKTIFAIPEDVTSGTTSSDLHHLVSLMCDKRLFVPNKLLGRLLPLVVYTMRTKTMPVRVKQAALVAYGKFMPLSAEISAFAAPSFFSAMVHSPSPLLRCNLIAACCDFAFAQPTLFELYAPSLFRMSLDKSPSTRESTILVLSHLMSNDMIQTRSVLSEPARCICDTDRYVKEAAQAFFKELNSRNETIVQLLPEFLYRLSSSDERLSIKSYKIVFDFLIQLLKEKNKTSTDSMIDRVCLKFSNTDMDDTDAPHYLLIALNKFAQNDGGLQRLHDNWRHWSKFLCHSEIAQKYRTMIETLHNSSKNEDFRSQCNEIMSNIDKINHDGLRHEDIKAKATSKKSGRGKKVTTARDSPARPSNRASKRKNQRSSSSESEESEEEEEEEEESDSY